MIDSNSSSTTALTKKYSNSRWWSRMTLVNHVRALQIMLFTKTAQPHQQSSHWMRTLKQTPHVYTVCKRHSSPSLRRLIKTGMGGVREEGRMVGSTQQGQTRLRVWVHVKRRGVTFTAPVDERHQLRVCPFPTCIWNPAENNNFFFLFHSLARSASTLLSH